MKRSGCLVLAVLVSTLVLSGCASAPREEASGRITEAESFPPPAFLNTSPRGGELVFIGVAGHRSKREEAIQYALEDAARKAAMYRHVWAYFALREKRGLGYLDIDIATDKRLVYAEDYKKYTEDLRYDASADIFENRDLVMVRTRYAASAPIVNHPVSSGRPSWTEVPPQRIASYPAGVGYANPHRNVKDAVSASCEAAVYALVRNLSSTVSSSQTALDENGSFLSTRKNDTVNEVVSSGALNGFYVLEIWIDPSNRSVWTLAICSGSGGEN
ncbi:MAG: LPP20 family lipoprotein [Treponema sp.]|jgi:hypothetical protein|nr:LPP20 family lipoprotein [Treponema sp.]